LDDTISNNEGCATDVASSLSQTLEHKMIDSTGYILPSKALNQVYLSRLPMFVVGLVIAPLLGLSTVALLFKTAILLAVLIVGLYFYTKQYKWVYLSSKGIQGLNLRGGKATIEWDDPITLKPITAFSGIKGFAVQSAKNRGSLFIPTSIATTTEFQSNLNRVAPQSHPLLEVSNNVL